MRVKLRHTAYYRQLRYRLRRRVDKSSFRPRRRYHRNRRPLYGRPPAERAGIFYPRHRRAGYESDIRRQRHTHTHGTQRGMLVGLRLFYRNFFPHVRARSFRVCPTGLLGGQSLRSGNPMHGIHEFQSQAGTARRSLGRRYSRRPCILRRKKLSA